MSLELRIAAVDWDSMQYEANRGSAVPKLLREICEGGEGDWELLNDLMDSLYQQETFEPDLAPVLPALLGLLEEPTFRLREELLLFMSDFLIGFSRRADWPLLGPDLPNRSRKLRLTAAGQKPTRTMDADARAVFQALVADAALLLHVAESDTGSARLRAAQIAAYLPSSGSQGLELFARLLKRARDPIEKAVFIIALGVLSAVTNDHRHMATADAHLRSRDTLVRGCAAASHAATAASDVADAIWVALGKLLKTEPMDAEKFPWMHGAAAGLAASALARLGQWDCERAARLLIDGLAVQHEKSGRSYDDHRYAYFVPALLAEPLVAMVFAPFWERCDPPLPEELDPLQTEVFRTLAHDLEIIPRGLAYVGLLHFGKRALRYLNETQQGALDTRVDFEFAGSLQAWPVWKLWYLVSDGLASFPSLAEALKRQLEPAEIWRVCLDLNSGSYERSVLSSPSEENPFAVKLAERFAKQLLPQLEDFAQRLVKRKRPPNRAELTLALTPLVRGWKATKKPVSVSVLKPLISLYLKHYPHRAKELHKLLPKANKGLVPKRLL